MNRIKVQYLLNILIGIMETSRFFSWNFCVFKDSRENVMLLHISPEESMQTNSIKESVSTSRFPCLLEDRYIIISSVS